MIGLIVRIILMPLFTHSVDVGFWALVIQHIEAGAGLYDIYGYWYTPVWGYVLGMMSGVLNLLGITEYGRFFAEALIVETFDMIQTATITTLQFNVIIKIPMLISDILVGYLIYKMIFERTRDEKKATYGFALWFLCPLVIHTSAMHGTFDSIAVLFMVLSVYALYKGRYFLAGASLAVAILTKLFPAYIIFAMVAFIAMKHKGDKTFWKRLGMAALGLCFMALLIYVPQIIDGTIMESLRMVTWRAEGISPPLDISGDDPLRSLFGASLGLPYLLQPFIMVLAAVLAYRAYKKSDGTNDDKVFFSCLLITTAIIFAAPINMAYLLVVLPFLIFFIVMFNKRFMVPYAVLCIAPFLKIFTEYYFLMSVAAYTNLIDMGNLISLLEWLDTSMIFGVNTFSVVLIGYLAVQYVAIWLIIYYWIKHERGSGTND